MMEWHSLDYQSLRAAYLLGAVTPTQVVQHHLRRIAALNGKLCHFIEVDGEGASAAAQECSARFASGIVRPLEGMLIAVKSNLAVAGLRWNAGMALRAEIVAEEDSEVVARLRRSGAIILGTANMHEAALGAVTDNPFYGRAMNPFKPDFTTGGSSGGSGGAVAAGLCTAALGTDTLGSVRIPAAYNGIYGMISTHGAISAKGLVPLSQHLDNIGPLARSVEDIDDILAVLRDDAAGQSEPELRRLLVLANDDGLDCEPEILAAYERGKAVLAQGPQEPLILSDSAADIRFAGFVTAARELSEHLGDAAMRAPEKLSEELHFLLRYAASRSAQDMARAKAILQRTAAEIQAAMGDDGLLLMPTAPQAAFAHGIKPPANQAAFTGLANIAGLPAISVPAGLNNNALPIALQLVGPAGSEASLIAAARRLDMGLNGYAASPMMNS